MASSMHLQGLGFKNLGEIYTAEVTGSLILLVHWMPVFESKALLEHFVARPESGLDSGHVRIFSRRVRQWRAMQGPEKRCSSPRNGCRDNCCSWAGRMGGNWRGVGPFAVSLCAGLFELGMGDAVRLGVVPEPSSLLK